MKTVGNKCAVNNDGTPCVVKYCTEFTENTKYMCRFGKNEFEFKKSV